jgi:hypothetical protein
MFRTSQGVLQIAVPKPSFTQFAVAKPQAVHQFLLRANANGTAPYLQHVMTLLLAEDYSLSKGRMSSEHQTR